MDTYRCGNDQLTIAVNAAGAELTSLRHARAGEMLWGALPVWPQHAPNLFPIVGQLVGDTLRYDGATYTLTRHGFARRRRFAWLERTLAGCALELHDDEQTHAIYPFAFNLRIAYAVDGDALRVTYTVRNSGDEPLPASVGAHPAFRWPLADGVDKTAHQLVFSADEPAPIRRLADGLLQEESFASPIIGRTLALDESLFAADAIIMDRLASTSVRFSAPGTPAIEVAWTGFAELGLWMKPGADFLCIEPWHGYSSPVDFDGEFPAKPGLLHIEPDQEAVLTMRIRVLNSG